MSQIKNLLEPVVEKFADVTPDHEIEVLQEVPVETLYFALKDADTELVHWAIENTRTQQLQGIIDLDCWSGDVFHPQRFMNLFHVIARCSPPKIRDYMKELDPEVIVRALMEFVDVLDFDPQEPPNVPEENLILSPDNKYAIILKEKDPNLRESILHWLNKLSAADLDLMRRHLESCKWEQKSEIEEFGYNIKKGRLEDMGFVDKHEACAIYSRGHARDLKVQLLENPLEEKVKQDASEFEEVIDGNFMPDVIRVPLSEAEFFGNAVKQIEDHKLQELLLMESFRCINMSVIADDMLHESLESIKHSADRSRRYLDLGLFFLANGEVSKCIQILKTQPLKEVLRLGWLLVRDLVQAATALRDNYSESFWGVTDSFLIQKLQGRHPELFESELKSLGCSSKDFISLEAVSKTAERLAILASIAAFYQDKLSDKLGLGNDPLASHESMYSRLLTAFVRQSMSSEFSMRALNKTEWAQMVSSFNRASLDSLAATFSQQAPDATRLHLQVRFAELLDDLEDFITLNKEFPEPTLFGALRLKATDDDETASDNGAPPAEA